MRAEFRVALVVTGLAWLLPCTTAQSFSCGQAGDRAELAICADPQLRQLDTALTAAYEEALAQSGAQHSALIDSQRHWSAATSEECGPASLPPWVVSACLFQFYRGRVAKLQEWSAPPDLPRRPDGAPRMNSGDEVYCDEIISSVGITLSSSQGEWGQPLSTPCSFRPPVDITIVARADPMDLRIRYAAEQVIFNWELDRNQLRIDGGPASGLHQSGAGAIPSGKYVTVRWLVTPLSQEIYVDGQLRFHHNGDYSQIDRPVSVFTAEGSSISVKSIVVRSMSAAPDDPVLKRLSDTPVSALDYGLEMMWRDLYDAAKARGLYYGTDGALPAQVAITHDAKESKIWIRIESNPGTEGGSLQTKGKGVSAEEWCKTLIGKLRVNLTGSAADPPRWLQYFVHGAGHYVSDPANPEIIELNSTLPRRIFLRAHSAAIGDAVSCTGPLIGSDISIDREATYLVE
jgi:uncharacterized protein YecT (DUF1311 family)